MYNFFQEIIKKQACRWVESKRQACFVGYQIPVVERSRNERYLSFWKVIFPNSDEQS